MGLHDLIPIVPELVKIFLAGFIFMSIYNWLTSSKMSIYVMGLWSLFINVLIENLCSLVHNFIYIKHDFDEASKVVIYIIVAAVFAVIAASIYNGKVFGVLTEKIGRKTVHNYIFDDMIDFEKRTIVTAYLKNSDVCYRGIFKYIEEKGANSYIGLIGYQVRDKQTDTLIFDPTDGELKSSVVLYLQDIERMELFYEEDSELWKRLYKDNEE